MDSCLIVLVEHTLDLLSERWLLMNVSFREHFNVFCASGSFDDWLNMSMFLNDLFFHESLALFLVAMNDRFLNLLVNNRSFSLLMDHFFGLLSDVLLMLLFNDVLVLFVDDGLVDFMNVFLMNDGLMDFMDYRLGVFMQDVLMMLVEDILVVLMDNVLMSLLDNWLLNFLLNNGSLHVLLNDSASFVGLDLLTFVVSDDNGFLFEKLGVSFTFDEDFLAKAYVACVVEIESLVQMGSVEACMT